MEHRVFLSPLTDSEKQELRKQQFKLTKMIGFGFAFMCLPILMLAKHIPTDVIFQLLIFLVVVLGSIAGMLTFAFGPGPLFRKDLDSNSKTIIQGVLENKIQEEVRSGSRGTKLGNHYYYFLMGDSKVKVTWLQYYAFRIGESIEIHIGTNSDWILGIERKSAVLPQDYSYRVLIGELTLSEKLGMAFRITFATIILSVFIFVFGYTAYNTYPENWGFFIPAGSLALAIAGLISYLIYTYTSAIIIGKKEIVEGTLRGKEWRRSDYYFILGGQKFRVGNLRFNSPQVGEPIRIIRLSNGDILDWNFA